VVVCQAMNVQVHLYCINNHIYIRRIFEHLPAADVPIVERGRHDQQLRAMLGLHIFILPVVKMLALPSTPPALLLSSCLSVSSASLRLLPRASVS